MPLYAPGAGPHDVMFVDGGVRVYVRRELAIEPVLAHAALERLIGDPSLAEEGPPGLLPDRRAGRRASQPVRSGAGSEVALALVGPPGTWSSGVLAIGQAAHSRSTWPSMSARSRLTRGPAGRARSV